MNKSTLPYNPHKSFILAKGSKLLNISIKKIKKQNKTKKKNKTRERSSINMCCTYTTSF